MASNIRLFTAIMTTKCSDCGGHLYPVSNENGEGIYCPFCEWEIYYVGSDRDKANLHF